MSFTRERGRLAQVGIAVALLILSFIAILSYRAISTLQRHAVAVGHAQTLIVTLEEAFSTLKDVALAQHSYMLSRDRSHRDSAATSSAQADLLLRELARLSQESDEPQAFSEFVAAGRALLSGEPFEPGLIPPDGRKKMDTVRALYRRIKAEQEFSLLQSRAEASASASRASRVLVVGGTVSVATLLLAFALLRRQILHRTRAEATALEHEREIRFIHDTVVAIGNSGDARSALALLLEKVRSFTGWAYGQAWLPDASHERMSLALASPPDGGEHAAFKAENEPLQIGRGLGLIGTVWQSRTFAWRSDVTPGSAQVRRPLILAAGFRSWAAFPVLSNDRTLAVVEFFDRHTHSQDERMLRVIAILTRQLGPFIERKQAAEQIAALNADLTRYAGQLDVSNKELESFTYSVSHDLRSPLRAIDGYSRMLEEDYAGRLDAEAARLLKVVRDNARRMNHLIDDLLAFSRLGRKSISRRPVDMTQCAREAYAALQEPGRAPELDLPPLPPAHGDAALIKQVWSNLLSNAVKYSSTQPAPRIAISAEERVDETCYCVRDNGVGFDMSYAHKLFGVFQRLHAVDEFPGTGVGLAIVQRIVSRHGGRVWAEAAPGEGATFCFTLPKENAHAGI